MSVTRREEVIVPSLRLPLGHYAQAVRFGNLLFGDCADRLACGGLGHPFSPCGRFGHR